MLDRLQEQFLNIPDGRFLEYSGQYARDRILQEQANVSAIDAFVPRGIMDYTIFLMVIIFGMLFWWERKKLYNELWPVEEKKK